MRKIFKEATGFILRNGVWLMLGVIAVILINPTISEIRTFFAIIALESLALGLSGVALYVYTKIEFSKEIMKGEDAIFNDREREGALKLLGMVFVGVHILIGLVVLGVYIAQFAN